MKFTAVVAAILSMATFAIAVPVAVPAPAKGTELLLFPYHKHSTDRSSDVEVRQNHGKCVKSNGGGVMEDVNC